MKYTFSLFTIPGLYSVSVIVFLILSANSCEKAPVNVSMEPSTIKEAGSAIQQTSQDLFFSSVQEHKSENFVISPLSIQWALYMAYNGADGSTKAEMKNVLHLDNMDQDIVNEQTKYLYDYFSNLLSKGHLDIHNGLFYDQSRVDMDSDYLKRLMHYFHVNSTPLNFNDVSAVESINDWVSDKTYDKIDKVLSSISENDLLFLINALYLKADWAHGFSKESTTDQPFVTMDGKEIQIPTMQRTGLVDYSKTQGHQVLRLPLADSALYAYFIMATHSENLSDVINMELIESVWKNNVNFKNERMALQIPVVETKTHLSIIPPLQSLGMSAAFESEKANFTRMGKSASGQPLFITKAFHDAYLKMDEKGVEGAAVTTIGVGVTSIPSRLAFNKPFMYLIVDHEMGLPLFIGQFTGLDPSK